MHGLLVPLGDVPVREGPATHAAAVRPHAVHGVDPFVSAQAVRAAEAFSASFAHERLRLLQVLDKYVTIQAVLGLETLGAIRARQGLLLAVALLVPQEVGLPVEAHLALGTGVRPLVGVRC